MIEHVLGFLWMVTHAMLYIVTVPRIVAAHGIKPYFYAELIPEYDPRKRVLPSAT